MSRRIIILAFLPLFLFSCSEEKRQFFKRKKSRSNDFVLEMQHFFSDSEENMSFPVWFDDSLIKENKVRSIHRKVYNLNEKIEDFASIKLEKQYDFDKEGHLEKMQVQEYYEGQQVSDVTFLYSGVKDVHGFQKVTMTRTNDFNDGLSAFRRYEVEQTTKTFLAYVNVESGNYLFYLPNEKHWGALSVDSILGPTSEDLIVYGSPRFPAKRYRVVNRVNEFEVKTVEYAKNSTNPKVVRFEQEPFNYKRTIQYNKKGDCVGFIDSTFSLDHFITRRRSRFSFENNQLPNRVTHSSALTSHKEKNVQIETFEYTHYD